MLKKTVLITGGAKRLGAQVVRAFADAGYAVAIHYQHSATQAQQLADELKHAKIFQADLGNASQRNALFADVKRDFGSIDCIVNNASLFEPDTGLEFDQGLYGQQHQVNVVAPLHLTQLLAQHCAARQQLGCAIQILDQKVDNLNPDYFSYTLTKLTLRESIKLQAQALAPYVRVCGVAPGLMYLSGPQSEENFNKAAKINLLETPIEPKNVAKACLSIAENAAINGAIINVDNGQHLVPLGRDVMFVVENP